MVAPCQTDTQLRPLYPPLSPQAQDNPLLAPDSPFPRAGTKSYRWFFMLSWHYRHLLPHHQYFLSACLIGLPGHGSG